MSAMSLTENLSEDGENGICVDVHVASTSFGLTHATSVGSAAVLHPLLRETTRHQWRR